jgi:hypothetical protein
MAAAAGDSKATLMCASLPHLPRDKNSVLCRICGKPVSVSTAKADADGNAIHEECYALEVQFEQAGRDILRPVYGVNHTGDGNAGTSGPWKLIALEVPRENEPKKIGGLLAELNKALDGQQIDAALKRKLGRRKAG